MMEIFIPVVLIVEALLMKLSAEAFGSGHPEKDDKPLPKLHLSASVGQLDEPSFPSFVEPVDEASPSFGFLDPNHPPEVSD